MGFLESLSIVEAKKHLSKDPKLRPYLDTIELPERNPSSDVYSGLISSIVSQQLSVKAAATIHGRFINLFESGYPVAEELLSLSDEELRGVGLSGQKSKYVRNVATFFQEKHLFQNDWSEVSNEEIINLLTEIKGVGRWTVEMILMFVLRRQDVFPVLDLGIQYGMKKVYNLTGEKKVLAEKMIKHSKKWKPYRTVACLYLWELANKKD